MAKVRAIVNRALRLLAVKDARQPLQAVDLQTGLEVLNAMMVRWEADGISVGWEAVSAGDADVPAPPETEGAIAYNLAVELAPEFGVEPSAIVLAKAVELLGKVQADVVASTFDRLSYDLPRGESDNRTTLAEFNRGY